MIGGTSISGGQTSIVGTALGALVLTLVTSDLTAVQSGPGVQNLVTGLIVIATVSLTRIGEKRRSPLKTT